MARTPVAPRNGRFGSIVLKKSGIGLASTRVVDQLAWA